MDFKHPNAPQAWQQWSEDQTLHVVATYSNPYRYKNRRRLFHDFLHHMRSAHNVKLYVVEVAFGERPFEVTTENDIQLRSKDILWQKENALNIGVNRLPVGWKYAAYVDGDFHFTRHDWALETIHQLQYSPWVQMYSGYAVMSEHHVPLQNRPSFAYAYHEYYGGTPQTHRTIVGNPAAVGSGKVPAPVVPVSSVVNYGQHKVPTIVTPRPVPAPAVPAIPPKVELRNTTPGATGGAWAFTKESFNKVGGFLDTCILGAADWYMSFGLVGNTTDGHPEAISCGKAYEDSIRRWQDRAFAAVRGNIGYVSNFAIHGWHGDLKNRGYGERWKILQKHNFDPLVDISKDWQGLLQWAGNKPGLEADVRKYFHSRSEDSTECFTKPLF